MSLEEVRRLGETDAGFRRSIVSSEATLTTIVEASRQKLRDLRHRPASPAQDYRLGAEHGALQADRGQYRELGLRADYVHSQIEDAQGQREGLPATREPRARRHRSGPKARRGLRPPLLAVAAVFSIFSNLCAVHAVRRPHHAGHARASTPFDPVNDGVSSSTSAPTSRPSGNDFQEFAEADQEFFAQLIDETIVEPVPTGEPRPAPRTAPRCP